MSALAWWIVPVVATIGAIAYVTWRGRPRPPEDTHEAIESRERFRRAMEQGVPGRRGRRAPDAPDARAGDDGPAGRDA